MKTKGKEKKRTAKAKADTIDRKNKRANKYRFCYQ